MRKQYDKSLESSPFKGSFVYRSGKEVDPDTLPILTIDKEFDESFRNKDVIDCQTVSAEATIKTLRFFAEEYATVDFY